MTSKKEKNHKKTQAKRRKNNRKPIHLLVETNINTKCTEKHIYNSKMQKNNRTKKARLQPSEKCARMQEKL